MLHLHSWTSWILLVLLVVVLIKSLLGWINKQDFTATDNKLHLAFVSTVHLQFIFGLILYLFLSPHVANGVFTDFGATMKDPMMRFFGVEHIVGMIIVVAMITIGRAKSKRQPDGVGKHRVAFVFYMISIFIMLGVLPWMRDLAPMFRF